MKQLPSVAAIYEQMDQARRVGPLVTNFYPAADKLQRSIERGELFSMTVGNVLFVLRRDRDFLHLSYMAGRAADLAAALHEVVGNVTETLTVDVLGKREQVDEIAQLFATVGFRAHCALHRMTMTSAGDTPPVTPDPEVVFATTDDATALAGMLEAALDRFAEQIPDEDEMRRAAADRKILVIRSGPAIGEAEVRGVGTPTALPAGRGSGPAIGEAEVRGVGTPTALPAGRGSSPVGSIAGLLVFEVTGQSSLLRHWVVDGAHRDRRVGARLMRRYFADCKDVRRFVLWVISDNDNAIDRYRHYGYQQDGLIDQVLIRRAL